MKSILKRLDHLGIAVRDLERSLGFYRDVLGLRHEQTCEESARQLTAAVLDGGNTHVELLQSTVPGSLIDRFIEKRGEGLHHLCFEVDDIQAALAKLRQAGVRLVDEQPLPGVGGALVAFVHPAATGGVLLELSEKKKQPSTGSD
jgi:methylmalonyl-CoA/ethylmalonyl-CoA epimerase